MWLNQKLKGHAGRGIIYLLRSIKASVKRSAFSVKGMIFNKHLNTTLNAYPLTLNAKNILKEIIIPELNSGSQRR